MEFSVWSMVRAGILAAPIGAASGDVRIPARAAACSAYAPDAADVGTDDFPLLWNIPWVERIERKDGWLLFTLTDAFYDACVEAVQSELPPAETDLGRYAINRMQCLARHGGRGCPRVPQMQRALWLCLGAHTGASMANRAERAILTMQRQLPPAERAALSERSGAFADACARLLHAAFLG